LDKRVVEKEVLLLVGLAVQQVLIRAVEEEDLVREQILVALVVQVLL
jgi:transcriptional regulator CtsR